MTHTHTHTHTHTQRHARAKEVNEFVVSLVHDRQKRGNVEKSKTVGRKYRNLTENYNRKNILTKNIKNSSNMLRFEDNFNIKLSKFSRILQKNGKMEKNKINYLINNIVEVKY